MHVHATAFGLSEGHTDAEVERVGDLLAEVGRNTVGVRAVYAGTNQHPLAAQRTHGIVVTMDDTEVQAAYRSNPIHAEAGAALRAMLHSGIGLDTGPMADGVAASATGSPVRVHATLFRLQDDEAEVRLLAVMDQMAVMALECPGVVAVYAGTNQTRHVGPMTHAVVVVSDGVSGSDQFDAHPLRAEVGQALTAIVRDPVGLDLGPEAQRP